MRINYSEFDLKCPLCQNKFKIRVEMTDNTKANKKIIDEACYQLGNAISYCNHKKMEKLTIKDIKKAIKILKKNKEKSIMNICTSSDMHPYECDRKGKCIHCDKKKIKYHNPKTCALCNY